MRTPRSWGPLCVAVGMACLPAAAEGAKADRVARLLEAYDDAGVFSGAALVAEGGEVIYRGGFGSANRVWGIPNAPSTRFLIGSATKQFTAILILQLAEAGQLRLDGTLSDYLPDYRQDTGRRISLHHMLSHTSGLPDYYTREFYELHKDRFYPHEEFVERFLSRDLDFEPGTDGAYSSANYYLLGLIIEEVTGKSFDAVLQGRILDPCGMFDTGMDRFAVPDSALASGYIKTYLGFRVPPFEIPESSAYAAGAMFSTVEDLYLFDRALREGRLLSADAAKHLIAPVTSVGWMPDASFAYGGMVAERNLGSDGEPRLIHQMAGSTTTGFTTIVTRVPEDGHFVALLANSGPGHFHEALHEMTGKILAVLSGHTVEHPKRSLADHVGSVLSAAGVEAAIREYERCTESGEFAGEEGPMNRLGYDLMAAGRYSDAWRILRLNTERYPQSANAFDSLAEALEQGGRAEAAVEAYRRALELEPDGRLGTRARERISFLRGRL